MRWPGPAARGFADMAPRLGQAVLYYTPLNGWWPFSCPRNGSPSPIWWTGGLDWGLVDELVESALRASHHRCETPLHLLRRDLVEKMANVPAIARRVTQPARPFAIELVLRFALDVSGRLGRAANRRVGIVDLQVPRDPGAAQRQRSQDAVFRELFSQHGCRTTEIEHGVPEAPIRIRQSKLLGRPENRHIELDRLGGVIDLQVCEQVMDLHCGSVFLSMKFFPRTPFRHPTATFLVGAESV